MKFISEISRNSFRITFGNGNFGKKTINRPFTWIQRHDRIFIFRERESKTNQTNDTHTREMLLCTSCSARPLNWHIYCNFSQTSSFRGWWSRPTHTGKRQQQRTRSGPSKDQIKLNFCKQTITGGICNVNSASYHRMLFHLGEQAPQARRGIFIVTSVKL